jgi:hypothetical protein
MRTWQLITGLGLLLLSFNNTNAQFNDFTRANNANVNANANININAFATNIVTFLQLVEAVENGNNVRAIIHFDHCQVTNPSIQSQVMRRLEGASTRFNFTEFLHARERINGELRDAVTTTMKTIIEQPSGEVFTLFGRLSVFEDNTATLHVDFFDPVLHKQGLVVDWLCNISNGRDDNGLVLFNFS